MQHAQAFLRYLVWFLTISSQTTCDHTQVSTGHIRPTHAGTSGQHTITITFSGWTAAFAPFMDGEGT